MATQYKFDFSSLTWDDMGKLPKGGLTALAIVDRLCVGGIRDLSLGEVAEVLMPQFTAAYVEWMRYGKIGDIMPRRNAGITGYGGTVSFSADGVAWNYLGVTKGSMTIGGNADDTDDVDESGLRDMLDDIEGLD